jgi:hypothetical protein
MGGTEPVPLQKLLGNTQEVKDLFARWNNVFPPMAVAAKQFLIDRGSSSRERLLQALGTFIENTSKNNKTFLKMCLDTWQRELTKNLLSFKS